jgi:outer membrane murein-binding lipoprotein Lpp
MKLTTTMMAVAAFCTLASGCVSTQTAADRASTVKLNAAMDEAYLNP